jgi:myo-inositol-1(or 4)-monophosphatase
MLEERFDAAKSAVLEAGAMLREVYPNPKSVQHKGSIDLLTQYDLRSEQILINRIKKRFPNDAFLSEESLKETTEEEYWLIDPIDGTTNFAHGLPEFAICVSYLRAGEPVLGIIYNPARDELFHAIDGAGAYLNERAIRVSTQSDPMQSLLATGFPYDPGTTNFDVFGAWAKIFYRSRGIRHIGCASMNTAYIAAGRLDAYWETNLHAWDVAAGFVLINEAGGTVTRLEGTPNPLREPCSILATNGHLHGQLLNLLHKFYKQAEE